VPEESEIERLVQRVTELVLARLAGPQRPEQPARRRPIELLLPVQPAGDAAVLRALAQLARAGNPVACRTTAAVADWLQRSGLRSQLDGPVTVLDDSLDAALAMLDGRALWVLGSLGFGLAGRLARLEDDDPFVRLLSQALLRGRRVLLVAEELQPAAAVAGPVAARAAGLLAELERLGCERLAAAGLADRVAALEAGDTTASQALGGLVTEADVEQLAADGPRRLSLAAGTIVTPLARSRASELGLELIEVERG
jgi:hypothetical protein